MPTQVENGKAFEYAIAKAYYDYLDARGTTAFFQADENYQYAKSCFEIQGEESKNGFYTAALKTIETMVAIEPDLIAAREQDDWLRIRLASDQEGVSGDVRDVIFSRNYGNVEWEMGISAKNNHDAVKHSRLSQTIDFGREWMDCPCSDRYLNLYLIF